MVDNSGMKKIIEGFPEQIKNAYGIEVNIKLKGHPENIIICGMGGSGIAGELLSAYLADQGLKIPIHNVHDYSLPVYTSKNSLIIISSYSGNTEETVSLYRQALKKGHNIIIITTGGKLLEYAKDNNIPHVIIPKGLQPRNAVAYLFFPILKILEINKLIEDQSSYIKNLLNTLNKNAGNYDKQAVSLADELYGRIPIVYSSSLYYSVAYRWKCEFNENAKIISYSNVFPELDHNEINGFKNSKWPLHIIILKDEYDNKRIIKRMQITKNLIKQENPDIKFTEITIKGDDLLTRMLSAIYLGDLISYYLALKYSTDPTPVEIIEKLKKELGPYIN